MISQMIVIVYDESRLLALLQDILEGEGYHLVAADHSEGVAGIIAGQEPCLFLIDVMLPGLSDITLAEQLHTGAHSAIPGVAISASEVIRQRAAGSGTCTSTLEKPFDLESLLSCVARHVTACSNHGRKGQGAHAESMQS